MGKQKAVSIIVVMAVLISAGAAFVLWPKHYTVGRRLSDTTVFWNDQEAFVFLTEYTTGRSQNIFQEKLSRTRYNYLTILAGGYTDFSKSNVVAYHLSASGQLDRFALPEHTVAYGSWGLNDGQLQLAPPAGGSGTGFRWDGSHFQSLSAKPLPAAQPKATSAADPNLKEDDPDADNSDENEDPGLLPKAQRRVFKEAGWHYKFLNSYGGQGQAATLPVTLSGDVFNLMVESFPAPTSTAARLDFMALGTKSIRLSGDKLAGGQQTLWDQAGWRDISKPEYQALQQQYGHKVPRPVSSMLWLWALLFLMLWRFGSWIHVLFSFATVKSRVLKNMATSYSFPPATPAQFPTLDTAALDRYTREFEGMGFVRLLDFSLVTDAGFNPASFCRLLAHPRHHCFAELSQLFPRGKTPLLLKCSIQSCLQNGWTLSFSDRKPQAASSLLRRRKAMGICMPEASASELLTAFLKMREQICLDLGISVVNDDSLQAYIDKMQRAASEMRDAVQGKSFVKGVPEVYLRKFSLLKTKPEYIWLGDYPKEAEQRKQGFNTLAASAR